MNKSGVYKISLGETEKITPASLFYDCKAEKRIEDAKLSNSKLPFCLDEICFKKTKRGCTVTIPSSPDEDFYGCGLQLKSVCQTGKKKNLRVNSDPVSDTGDSHAPVPFYVSTAGYGVFIDTARYISVYFASHDKSCNLSADRDDSLKMAPDSIDVLYAEEKAVAKRNVVVDIPTAKGVDIYIFAGPDMKTAIMRYNLFSGGGVLPPMWGLSVWYRTYFHTDSKKVEQQVNYFRGNHIPLGVLGLEPSWQTHYYSCSYVWDKKLFENPIATTDWLNKNGVKLNLWEHLFCHTSAPIFEDLKKYSGDIAVWNGLVPDFSIDEASRIFRDYHKSEFVDKGISGFKFDECDNSDFIVNPWSFPENSEFPSGMDGEQMHSVMGMLYQKMMIPAFCDSNKRTYSSVRSSGALASSMPYVLYSDYYNHKDYVRAIVNMGFSGLLWTPEVRQCDSAEELIRRLQSVIMSPMALINAFMIKNPPWLQFDMEKNNNGDFLSDYKELEDKCRAILNLRMSLLPYLYDAFYEYENTGLPPFRAIVCDWPNDETARKIEDEYLVGNSLLFAPVFTGETKKEVYLPNGNWYNLFSGEKFSNGKHLFNVDLDDMLIFVKEGSLIPFAEPIEYIDKDTVFNVSLKKFGDGISKCRLISDDFESFNYKNGKQSVTVVTSDINNNITVSRSGDASLNRYNII